MKRLTALVTVVVIVLISLTALSAGAQSESDKSTVTPVSKTRHEKSLGLFGGFSTYNHSGYAGIDFQYEFAKHFRLSPSIAYSIKNNNKSALLIDVDMQFPFRVLRGFTIYPLAGVTFNNWTLGEPGKHTNLSRFGGNIGGGFDIYFTSFFKLEIQGKYSWMKDTSGGFFNVGFFYMF